MDQITLVAEQVQQLLNNLTDGHGFDHVERVRKIALQIAEQEGGDRQIIELAVLLHDVRAFSLRMPATISTPFIWVTDSLRVMSSTTSLLEVIITSGIERFS